MGKRPELQQVHEWLSDCPPEQAFFLSSGTYIRNLHELYDSLLHMREELFHEHCDDDKNDFYNWVKGAVGDEELASRLEKVQDRLKMVLVMKRRLDELDNIEYEYKDNGTPSETEEESKEPQSPEEPEPNEKKQSMLKWEMFFIGLIAGIIVGYILAALVQPLIG